MEYQFRTLRGDRVLEDSGLAGGPRIVKPTDRGLQLGREGSTTIGAVQQCNVIHVHPNARANIADIGHMLGGQLAQQIATSLAPLVHALAQALAVGGS